MRHFPTAPAPHQLRAGSVRRIMLLVLAMLVPAAAADVFWFGPGLPIQIVIASLSALLAESVMLALRREPLQPSLGDGSALVTAALLAFALPPLAPWWVAACGSAFAIVFAKHLFGGLGRNLFNPAMAGFALLLLTFPAEMSRWSMPIVVASHHLGFTDTLTTIFTGVPPVAWDAISSATPLDAVHSGLKTGATLQEVLARTSTAHSASIWSSLGILLGGLGLLGLRIIRWPIPVSMLAAVVVSAGLLNAIDPGTYPGVLFHLTSGATLLGAFFIACDPVTTAASHRGRLWFGAGVGLLTVVIRSWTAYPDGIAFAVLIMNLFVPLIDRLTVPRIYGHAR